MKKLRALFLPEIDGDIRLIALATSVRWFGWGFVEAFMPVFLFTFSATYAETGVLKSIYGIVFLLSLPIVSWFADRVSSKKLMIAALLVYPLISLSYFAAGMWSIVALVVLARFLNGIGYSLDSTGRSTYIRTHAAKDKVGTSFGYVDAVTNFWWLLAVLVSIFAVNFVPIPYLFLPIAPTALIGILLLRKLPTVSQKAEASSTPVSLLSFYSTFFKVIAGWSKKVRCLGAVAFFVEVLATVGEFFIPIYAFTQNESISNVMLLTVFATIPSLLSAPLGMIADKYKKILPLVCLLLAPLLIMLAFSVSFAFQLVLVFLVSISLQLLSLTIERAITLQVVDKELGTLSGAFQGVSQLAGIIGPILIGIALDLFQMPAVLLALALISVMFSAYCYSKKIA